MRSLRLGPRRLHQALRAPPLLVHTLGKMQLGLPNILKAAGQGSVQDAGGFHFFHFGRLHIDFADLCAFPPNAIMVRAMRVSVLAAAAGLAAPDKLRADFAGQRLNFFGYFQFLFQFYDLPAVQA